MDYDLRKLICVCLFAGLTSQKCKNLEIYNEHYISDDSFQLKVSNIFALKYTCSKV